MHSWVWLIIGLAIGAIGGYMYAKQKVGVK
ncbi:MAG: YtxH domain-containing protein [Candidatus Methanosuratincola sp.]